MIFHITVIPYKLYCWHRFVCCVRSTNERKSDFFLYGPNLSSPDQDIENMVKSIFVSLLLLCIFTVSMCKEPFGTNLSKPKLIVNSM